MVELERFEGNPILSPQFDWEKKGVFNPTVFYNGKEVIMLYRAVDSKGISRIGIAKSRDGVNFKKEENPLLYPEEEYERFGCEDPRITFIEEEERFYLTYVGVDNKEYLAPKTAIAISYDLKKFHKLGVISEEYNKDIVIFPRKFNGEYAILHRPYKGIKSPPIRISFQKRIGKVRKGKELIKGNGLKVGAGFVIELRKYWLLVYHEVEEGRRYVAKAALLDYNDPSHVIGKSREPILKPEEDYEKIGQVDNVVFPTGGFLNEGTLYVYYGAADYCIGLATIEVDELVKCILTTTD